MRPIAHTVRAANTGGTLVRDGKGLCYTVKRGIEVSSEIAQTLAEYIAAQILKQPNRKVTEAEPLISGGLIDSFHLVDLALFVEDRFGVRIDDSELNADTFDTLAQLADLIRQRRS